MDNFNPKIFHSNTDISTQIKKKESEYSDVYKKLTGFGVLQNPYTQLTPDDLAKFRSSLEASVDKRTKAYQAELAKQRANDALCKVFELGILIYVPFRILLD